MLLASQTTTRRNKNEKKVRPCCSRRTKTRHFENSCHDSKADGQLQPKVTFRLGNGPLIATAREFIALKMLNQNISTQGALVEAYIMDRMLSTILGILKLHDFLRCLNFHSWRPHFRRFCKSLSLLNVFRLDFLSCCTQGNHSFRKQRFFVPRRKSEA